MNARSNGQGISHSVDLRDVHRTAGEHPLQEHPHKPGVVAPCPCTHATGATQMLVEAGEHSIQRQSIMRCHQLCSLPSEVIRCKKRRDYVHLPRTAVDLKPSQHRPRQPATPPYYT